MVQEASSWERDGLVDRLARQLTRRQLTESEHTGKFNTGKLKLRSPYAASSAREELKQLLQDFIRKIERKVRPSLRETLVKELHAGTLSNWDPRTADVELLAEAVESLYHSALSSKDNPKTNQSKRQVYKALGVQRTPGESSDNAVKLAVAALAPVARKWQKTGLKKHRADLRKKLQLRNKEEKKRRSPVLSDFINLLFLLNYWQFYVSNTSLRISTNIISLKSLRTLSLHL
jgi:hypothetical protein